MKVIEINSEKLTLQSEEPISPGVRYTELVSAQQGLLTDYTIEHSKPRRRKDQRRRIKLVRKLRGFVIQFETETARVALFDEKSGHMYHYRFPSERLMESKIEVENQPFELSEIKITSSDYAVPIYQTEFRPMAPKESAKLVELDLGEEYEQMKQKIKERCAMKK